MFEKCHPEKTYDITGMFYLFYYSSSGGAQVSDINAWAVAHILLVTVLQLAL